MYIIINKLNKYKHFFFIKLIMFKFTKYDETMGKNKILIYQVHNINNVLSYFCKILVTTNCKYINFIKS